mmetsp:Transcript_17698/g.40452  ORF Transcript_17698/g.40452 Transcript_17698/m.40452 type:complete len:324 (+) Transcript_17698:2-973(+)
MIRSSSRSSGKHNPVVANNNNLSNHRAGIVKILLGQLQEHVTKPFGILQKQRVRMAVKLWQNPLQCNLYVPKKQKRQEKDLLFDDDDEYGNGGEQSKDQRFFPGFTYRESSNNNNTGQGDFISKYANKRITRIPPELPVFLNRLSNEQHCTERIEIDHSSVSSAPSPLPQQPTATEENVLDDLARGAPQQPRNFPSRPREHQSGSMHPNPEHYQQQLEEDLRTETAMLTTTLIASNDLDSVQQMETRMVEITTLIGQFSDLVQDQQEQVLQVHESAKETKDNLDKGQENLIDATERTKKSKHYKAWLILAMTFILLFFQILRN